MHESAREELRPSNANALLGITTNSIVYLDSRDLSSSMRAPEGQRQGPANSDLSGSAGKCYALLRILGNDWLAFSYIIF